MTACPECVELRRHVTDLTDRCNRLRADRLIALRQAERVRYLLQEAVERHRRAAA
jgi:hypothetical protein